MNPLSPENIPIALISISLTLIIGAVILMVRPDWREMIDGSSVIPIILGLLGLLLGLIGLRARDTKSKHAEEPPGSPERPEPINTTHTPHKGADDGDNITEVETKSKIADHVAHDGDGDDLGLWLDNHFERTDQTRPTEDK